MTNNLINSIEIKSFRGIKNLKIKDIKRVNFFTGDNNSGKTSLLEAISFIDCHSKPDLFDIVNRRHGNIRINNFIHLFNRDTKEIDIDFKFDQRSEKLHFSYELNKVLFDKELIENEEKINELKGIFPKISFLNIFLKGREISYLNINHLRNDKEIKYTVSDLDSYVNKSVVDLKNAAKVQYLSPFNHFHESHKDISTLLKNSFLKPVFIELLRLFDKDIEDILFLESGTFIPKSYELHIKLKGKDAEPLSIYGDGIKKAISLSLGLAKAKDGYLLIDEIETSLHYKYFEDIYLFLIKAAEAFNIQLFITTHSKETINTVLNIIRDEEEDLINFYTLIKTENKTICRVNSGKDLASQQEKFDVEVR